MIENTNTRNGLILAAGLVGGIIVMTFWWSSARTGGVVAPKEVTADANATSTTGTSDMPLATEGILQVDAQVAGPRVVVALANLEIPGWVVVHEVLGGHVGNALGATRKDEGTHEGVVVELLRPTVPNEQYMVVLYRDNGNKEFEVHTDIPMVTTEGDPIMQLFKTQ